MSSQSAGEEIASGTDVHVGLLVFDEEEDDAPEKIEKGNNEATLPEDVVSSMPSTSLVGPTIVEPPTLMEIPMENTKEATYESSSSETVVKPSSPLQASATPTTTFPAPPQRTFMPLRDPEPVVLTSQATEKETSHYQVPSLNLNNSAAKENASEDAGLVSSTTSSTQPTVAKESSETTIGVTVSPVTISNSPTIQTHTTVSTMTPPMSPPQTDQLLLSRATNVSPRLFLNDVSMSPTQASTSNKSTVAAKSQSDRRRSRSPRRITSTRSSPPLTRSAQRRRLATPHQSPTDSPISFVTPVRRTSPRRKLPEQKKPAKFASHSMTLRARSCSSKLTRSAKLPNTT
ncbi:flocculation protein FLO11-like [Xenia sp. Carnegie-2017]|uniref:flocculation protein FLO11-like n=1 Tax=Xenia sp. Carnegie-2017 TaxID=2897299 RepID=UPI001F03F6E0|nr:flocculation protein FLO11-like [Xenia sp. Carnegie-2017]